jgi:anti-anti-sigma regulatory factor
MLTVISAVILGSLFQIRDSSQPGGPGHCICIPSNSVAQLDTQALDSLFVASYDSRGYGGDIGASLYTSHR